MEMRSEFTGAEINPMKQRAAAASMRTKSSENDECTENSDPNVCIPESKIPNPPPVFKAVRIEKNPSYRNSTLKQLPSPPAKKEIQERKFVVAKKKSRPEESNPSAAAAANCDKCGNPAGKSKCFCSAYESLRASHEEFFNNEPEIDDEFDFDRVSECEIAGVGDERNDRENGELRLKRNRERLLEEARQSVPESGRVMHLVKAFEKLLMIPKSVASDKNKVIKWAMPGLQQPAMDSETQISSSSSNFYLTSESLGLDSRLSFSLDGSRESLSSRTMPGGRKCRPSSSKSSRTFNRRQCKAKQQKAISQKPFTLTTEQRGRCKEEKFMKKLQKKLGEEDKLRIPVAKGLPNTIDEPEILVKPPVKDRTKPVDLVLHSDTRAMERAEFDNQVAEKRNQMVKYQMEMERRRKLEEEEEIRRLRKECVPKALPMPHFDRPFVPRRSVKHLTIPKEPKFHLPQHKKMKRCMSSDD